MVKRFSALTAVFTLVMSLNILGADLSSFSPVDTIYNKPEIIEYINADNIDGVTAEAYLNDERLTVVSLQSAESLGIKTNYVFLVDESTSISNIQIAKIREALYSAAYNLRENETMTIVTFGKSIDVIADHSSDVYALESAIATINNSQGGTVFYDVIKKAADICTSLPEERNLVFVISDGADFTVGGHTYEETENYAADTGITLYGVALGDMSNANIDRFGQLMRSTGGEIAPCSLETIDDNTLMLMDHVRSCYAVVMKSKNNVISDTERLIIQFASEGEENSVEENIKPVHWIPDNTVPQISSIEQISETSLLVTFSEDVVGADIPANYGAVLNGRFEFEVSSASYDSSTNSASIVFDGGIYRGEYTIECKNITDNSMEKNSISETYTLRCKGEAYSLLNSIDIEALLLLPVILLIIAGITAYLVIRKRKGIIIHQNKMMFKDNMVDKEEIIVPETKNVCLVVTTPEGKVQKLNMKIYKSLIVGRASACDLAFSNDQTMSRQQFAIEESDGIFTIMNLSKTNVTVVNGVPVNDRMRLNDNDVIEAGNEKIVFKANS